MSDQPRHRYHARMRRVLDHVERHLDGELDLAALSAVAAFSPCHFHRQFAAFFGLPVARYVRLARLERAAGRLMRGADRVTEAAMDAGYDAPGAFARAFRRELAQSPSAFRSRPDWDAWAAATAPLHDARRRLMTRYDPADVTIREVPPVTVAVMEHRGDPATIPATVRRFIAWRRAHGLVPPESATFTVFHSDPRTTAPEDHRVDLCAGTDRVFGGEVEAGLIPGGRCAVLRVTGAADDLEPAATFLYRDWLPASGEELRDFPIYAQRVRFWPEVAEHEAVTDLFLPLR